MAFNNRNDRPKFKNQLSKNRQRQGLGHAPSFQSPGFPWLTGSQVDPSGSWKKIQFPNVARGFTIRNTDRFYLTNGAQTGSSPIVVFFGPEPTGSGIPKQVQNNHTFTLREPGEEKRFEYRTDHVYVGNMSGLGTTTPATGAFQIAGELTPTDKNDMIALTGSGIDE